MKYIMFESPTGCEMPLLFPNFMNHKDIAQAVKNPKIKPLSAGFVSVNPTGFVTAYGKSISMNMKSRIEDSNIIQHAFEME